MKISRIARLMGIVLIGLLLTAEAGAMDRTRHQAAKKAVTLSMDKPLIEFVAKAYADQMNSDDIARVQKILGQIDHITITFNDKEASDYVIRFKPLDERGLEEWMFNAGYLLSSNDTEAASLEPWMMDPEYLD
jgi:hypothetical protein